MEWEICREHHLTPSGWVLGGLTCQDVDAAEERREPPPDRIETWCERTYEDSMYGELTDWRRTFADPALSEEERARVRERFPEVRPR